jgi:hypothetical protein
LQAQLCDARVPTIEEPPHPATVPLARTNAFRRDHSGWLRDTAFSSRLDHNMESAAGFRATLATTAPFDIVRLLCAAHSWDRAKI